VSAEDVAAVPAPTAYTAGETLPALLGPSDMMRLWRIGRSEFFKLKKAGAFDAFLVRPAVGPKCYSGILVQRYLNGESLYIPTFGAKRKRA
jgi:hypothetical protein